MRLKRGAAQRSGVAAVEFAFVFPFILAFLLGIWDVGRLLEVQQVMSNAAREGGRQAASGQKTQAQVVALVTTYLQQAGLPTANATVTCTNITSGLDPTVANYQDRFEITVTIPFNDVKWSLIASGFRVANVDIYVVPSGFQLFAKVTWMSVLDKPFPNFPNPPVG